MKIFSETNKTNKKLIQFLEMNFKCIETDKVNKNDKVKEVKIIIIFSIFFKLIFSEIISLGLVELKILIDVESEVIYETLRETEVDVELAKEKIIR